MTKIESIKNISNTLVNALIVANKTVATIRALTNVFEIFLIDSILVIEN
jgi:hypothetical protein